ncbi:MAG: methionyl-tRNA formyltransferase [bacterium]|nr:methionyl-tRNA formyltransferase [bacterium]
MKKIIFFGSGKFSPEYLQALREGGWEVQKTIGKELLPPEEFEKLKPDLGIIAYFGKIIPKKTLELFPLGVLNVHHSLLPKLRGPAPVQYALLAGDEKTGVTIIRAAEKADAGEIIASSEVRILPDDTYLSLERRLIETGTKLLLEILPDWVAGGISPQKQDESQATYSKIIKTADGKIDWHRHADEIHRQIRALNPEPGTFTFFDGKRLIIMEACLNKAAHNLKSGQVLAEGPDEGRTDGSGFKIAASGGFIIPVKIKLEGKKETTPSAFLKGYPQILHAILT